MCLYLIFISKFCCFPLALPDLMRFVLTVFKATVKICSPCSYIECVPFISKWRSFFMLYLSIISLSKCSFLCKYNLISVIQGPLPPKNVWISKYNSSSWCRQIPTLKFMTLPVPCNKLMLFSIQFLTVC